MIIKFCNKVKSTAAVQQSDSLNRQKIFNKVSCKMWDSFCLKHKNDYL